eukprot:CAMPEP_0180825024 /NCGR_PEP_ID=MMETSP1038_2-20121128/72745_1 /TAXON_ID=632150 /ORGANISM="Azadinium spinosum, Strain 3D9" /LENGTH=130 /DNA_ID=CAMNT_0022867449 /DNA_START=235 /DNA_END=627 /DNA_ORIENTATION=+
MKGEVNKLMPTFEAFENRRIVFEPGCACVWVDVKLNAGQRWSPELKFQVTVLGAPGQFRGSRTTTCIVGSSSSQTWPLLSKSVKCQDWSMLSRADKVSWVMTILKMCALHHGYFEEFLRSIRHSFVQLYL